MKICLVAEGSYPYVVGGVSSWVDGIIKSFPENKYSLLTIVTDREAGGVDNFKYTLPENVYNVYEAYVNDYDWGVRPKEGRRTRLNTKEHEALKGLILNSNIDWETVFKMFDKNKYSVDDLLMGADFLEICKECYRKKYTQIVFTDFLWTMRSIYVPLFNVLSTDIPEAEVYHCVSTGYAGLLGCKAKHLYRSSLIITEHGIYTREREEDILRADWVTGIYKDIWIEQFYKMSAIAYDMADVVTCLYRRAGEFQNQLGCDEDKIVISPNGIEPDHFNELTQKTEADKNFINIGAVLRITPIKDVKTMIRAFYAAKQKVSNLKLWIMGPLDEEKEYVSECMQMVKDLGLQDVIFTGRIDVKEYLGRMDFTILTSISEGQPLTVLESFAASKPVICTDVGCCRELIYGEDDNFGTAGILTHVMNIQEISDAIVSLASSEELRLKMGEIGRNRVRYRYTVKKMLENYIEIYNKAFYRFDV